MKCNQTRPGFGLVSPCPFPTTITITPRAPPYFIGYFLVPFQGLGIDISFSFLLILLWSVGTARSTIRQVSLFLFFFSFFFVDYHKVWSSGKWLGDLFVSHFFLLFWGFFTPGVPDSFSLKSEWQQVSLSLQDSSKYLARSQQCCCLKGLHLFSNIQVF